MVRVFVEVFNMTLQNMKKIWIRDRFIANSFTYTIHLLWLIDAISNICWCEVSLLVLYLKTLFCTERIRFGDGHFVVLGFELIVILFEVRELTLSGANLIFSCPYWSLYQTDFSRYYWAALVLGTWGNIIRYFLICILKNSTLRHQQQIISLILAVLLIAFWVSIMPQGFVLLLINPDLSNTTSTL